MTKKEKDECLRKLQYIVDRANWGTIDRDENGLPLVIRYASDVAEAIEKLGGEKNMTKKEKIPASIPLAEFNKKIAQEYREKAQHLMKCADIIEGKEPTNDKYDLLKEFVDYCKKDVEHGNEEAKATIHCWLNLLLEQFLEERKDDERKDN